MIGEPAINQQIKKFLEEVEHGENGLVIERELKRAITRGEKHIRTLLNVINRNLDDETQIDEIAWWDAMHKLQEQENKTNTSSASLRGMKRILDIASYWVHEEQYQGIKEEKGFV